MKKGQLAEFLGIMVLLIVLMMVLLFTKVEQVTSIVESLQISYADYRQIDISTTANTLGYLTGLLGIPLGEMIGAYSCYDEEVIDFGVFDENVTYVIRTYMDFYYGEGGWIMQLKKFKPTEHYEYISTNNITDMAPVLESGSVSYDFVYALPCTTEKIGDATLYYTP